VLGGWAIPFTIFATVGVINAVNMCDGTDGLAGSLCLAALAMVGAAALYAGNNSLFTGLLPIMAAILAFLAFNMRFPWQRRAKVFMGNAGSAFLGFTIAWVVFRLTQNAAHPVSPVLAPWLLAPPLIDCLVLIARRLKLGRSPFSADRDHIHHLLLEAGFSPNAVTMGLTLISVTIGLGAALVLRTNAASEGHLVLGFVAMVAGYYWLTAQRSRAVKTFRRLRISLIGSRTNAQPFGKRRPAVVLVPERRETGPHRFSGADRDTAVDAATHRDKSAA
jgi:UDP-GlcNAc:undecaprenyl-phosphate GlcNAc-1-phosphate transferase